MVGSKRTIEKCKENQVKGKINIQKYIKGIMDENERNQSKTGFQVGQTETMSKILKGRL